MTRLFTLIYFSILVTWLPAEEMLPEAGTIIDDDVTRVAVLGYHDFSNDLPETAMRIRTDKFRKQLEVIRQLGITVISYEDFAAWKRGEKSLPEKCVLLTLDDGWRSVYTDAFPILKEHSMPFVLFLYKNYVDGGGKALSSEMIREMMEHGAAIGSHSVSHPFPGELKKVKGRGDSEYDAYLRKELGESKRFLEHRFETIVASYAYPGGYHTPEMFPLADEFEYEFLFTVQPGKVKRSLPNETLPRYMILGNYDRIFELAVAFQNSTTQSLPGGMVAGLTQSTAEPVIPEPGAVINTRLPVISADLSEVTDIKPETLTMKISGFGQVPAVYDPERKSFSWQVNRHLRQPICHAVVTWQDSQGKPLEKPLKWSFQIDLGSAYMPDSGR